MLVFMYLRKEANSLGVYLYWWYLHKRLDRFFVPRYCDGKLYIKTCLLFVSHSIHTSETSSHAYITDEDLLRSKCCTVLLFSDRCVVCEINNKQFLYIYPTVTIPGYEKRSNRLCNCHTKALWSFSCYCAE